MEQAASLISYSSALIVGCVFILAALSKARAREAFLRTLAGYRFVPERVRPALAFGVPVLELGVGALLVSSQAPLFAGVAAIVSLGVFSTAAVAAFGLRGKVDCGCFGSGSELTTARLLGRNAALACLGLVPVGLAVTDRGGSGTAAALIAVVASVLVLVALHSPVARHAPAEFDAGRRRLLQGGFAVAAASVLASVLPLTVAEAACGSCGTCSTEYYFVACSNPCCAYYWVRQNKWCDTYCSPCTWNLQEFCGVPGCGC